MTQVERENRLEELNQQCAECRAAFIKEGFEPITGKSCLAYCKIGQEIHRLEDPKWDAQDWSSSQLEDLYHN